MGQSRKRGSLASQRDTQTQRWHIAFTAIGTSFLLYSFIICHIKVAKAIPKWSFIGLPRATYFEWKDVRIKVLNHTTEKCITIYGPGTAPHKERTANWGSAARYSHRPLARYADHLWINFSFSYTFQCITCVLFWFIPLGSDSILRSHGYLEFNS